MQSNLIVHAGLHKTGTTLLQKSLFPHTNSLYIGKYQRKSISHLLYEKKSHNMIWSDESLLGRLIDMYKENKHESWVDMNIRNMRSLKKLNPDLKLILSFRHPNSWIPSIYSHYLKYGGTLASKDFFAEIIFKEDLLILPRIKEARQLFGNNFLGFYLEDLVDGKDVGINKFLQEFDGLHLKKHKIYNSGLHGSEKLILRLINRIPSFRNINHPDKQDFISKAFRRLGLTPFDVTKKAFLLVNSMRLSSSKKYDYPDYLSSLLQDYDQAKNCLQLAVNR